MKVVVKIKNRSELNLIRKISIRAWMSPILIKKMDKVPMVQTIDNLSQFTIFTYIIFISPKETKLVYQASNRNQLNSFRSIEGS